jgi:hypothetical protein
MCDEQLVREANDKILQGDICALRLSRFLYC